MLLHGCLTRQSRRRGGSGGNHSKELLSSRRLRRFCQDFSALTPTLAFSLHDLPRGKGTLLSAAFDQSVVDLCPLVSAPNTSDNRANKKQPDGNRRREKTAPLVGRFVIKGDKTVNANTRRFSRVLPRLLGLAAVLLIAAPPRADAQQAIGGLRIERTGHTATRLPGGKILVVGGENTNGPVRDSEVFEPASKTFSAATGLLTARADHTATSLADGRLFVIGGRASDRLLDSTEISEHGFRGFSPGPSLKRARAGHTATLRSEE